MALSNELEKSGSWLFRYRSFLPLGVVPVLAVGLDSFTYLAGSHGMTEFWTAFCFLLSLSGLVVRILTVGHAPRGTSGRNTRQQVADHLNTTGMYSLVRHPLYLGNYLVLLGFVMFFRSWWLVLLVTCLYALYYERIMFTEEAFLRQRFGDPFEVWAATTPAFIPRWHGWKAPALPFCWRTVLRREYSGFFLVALVFPLLDIAGDSVAEKHVVVDWWWLSMLAAGSFLHFILRFLKKRTRLLEVDGR